MSNLVTHAERELKLAGLFDNDSDYAGLVGDAALELVKTFAKQGHSGTSADMTRELFAHLSAFKPLTSLTNDPEEWMNVSEYSGDGSVMYQSRRRPDAFSQDGGTTYYLLDETPRVMHTSAKKIAKGKQF